ncbi:MAG: hypothetical protein EOP86_04910 [Verrucomicrobiaceae bacterium]|nr:MAG: hypothetical protein EOP86_04910 [Verrucomicrobiaceae bacterium]
MTKSPQFVFTDRDGWFDVLKAGEFPNTRNGQHALQLTSPEDLAAIVAQWEAEGRPEFLVDSDHFSYDTAHDTRALGWGTGLRVQGGVLQAQVRWSAEGQKDLDSGSYRFCSISVHTRDEPDQAEDAGKTRENPVRVRPFRLDSIALTNRPNIPGLRPLTNRATGPVPPPTPPQPTHNRMDHKAIAALLGLPESATDAEITNAATVLNNRARSAEEAAADADIARFAGVIADTAKPYWKSQLISNRAAALPVLEGMLATSAASGQQKPAPANGAGGFQPAPLHNRGDAAMPPPPGSGNAGGQQQLSEADKMARQNSAINLVLNRNRGISHADAFDIARNENPDLFK